MTTRVINQYYAQDHRSTFRIAEMKRIGRYKTLNACKVPCKSGVPLWYLMLVSVVSGNIQQIKVRSNWKYCLERKSHCTEHGGGDNDSESIHVCNARSDGPALLSTSRATTA
jgi:hypothetical protein